MAEELFYDEFHCYWFKGEVEQINERIKKLNKELFDRSQLSLSDFYEEINKDLPEGMKIGLVPLCDTIDLNYDYSELKENKDYEPITLEYEQDSEPPFIKLHFNLKDITYNH